MQIGSRAIAGHAEVYAVLTDPGFVVPPVAASHPDGGIEWLRANVARFSNGTPHLRRRALATTDLARLDSGGLRHRAAARTAAIRRAHRSRPFDVMATVARVVPADVLIGAFGMTGARAEDVAAVAHAYQPHAEVDPGADQALARLVGSCGGIADEATAARIGLLVQAFDATAGLVGNALVIQQCDPRVRVETVVAETLRHNPPVRVTRRQALAPTRYGQTTIGAGTVVELDLATANRDPSVFADPDRLDTSRENLHRQLAFGAGTHTCPGREHAIAIVSGVLESLRGCRLITDDIRYEPSGNLRIPATLVVTDR